MSNILLARLTTVAQLAMHYSSQAPAGSRGKRVYSRLARDLDDARVSLERYLRGVCGQCDAIGAPLVCACGEPACSERCLRTCARDGHRLRGLGQAPASEPPTACREDL